MDMPNYELDGHEPDDYGTEVLCSGWNPLVAAIVEPLGQVCRELLAELATADVDAFLQQIYRSQQS